MYFNVPLGGRGRGEEKSPRCCCILLGWYFPILGNIDEFQFLATLHQFIRAILWYSWALIFTEKQKRPNHKSSSCWCHFILYKYHCISLCSHIMFFKFRPTWLPAVCHILTFCMCHISSDQISAMHTLLYIFIYFNY